MMMMMFFDDAVVYDCVWDDDNNNDDDDNDFWNDLTLTLLELKMTSLCHQYRAKPACISLQSDQDILLAD